MAGALERRSWTSHPNLSLSLHFIPCKGRFMIPALLLCFSEDFRLEETENPTGLSKKGLCVGSRNWKVQAFQS